MLTTSNARQHSEFPRWNCIIKAAFPFKNKCQYECVVYKVEVHDSGSNKNINGKKVFVDSTQGAFKKDIITIELISHTKYTDIGLVYLCVGNKKRSKESILY